MLRVSKNGRHIEEQFAHTYFDAIGLGIDFTARDLQSELKKKGLPWELAKAFDGSAPISPTFRPVADFADLANINFHLEVNGETRQTGNSSLMLHPFAKIISFVSKYITLKMGDLIFTGTPAGVGPVKIGDQADGVSGRGEAAGAGRAVELGVRQNRMNELKARHAERSRSISTAILNPSV